MNFNNDEIEIIKKIKQYYKEKKNRIDLWTFLFNQLNGSMNEIFNMCENENNIHFVNGVLQTIGQFEKDIRNMKQKIELENGKDSDRKTKSVQYTLNMGGNSIQNNDLQIEDLEDIQNIDLKVFQYLIREQKMEFEEAIVLIIRERALILDFRDNLNNIDLYSIDSQS